jgi:hypothetical protein
MRRYHINNQGNVGVCRARVACPYGDMEKDHFSSRADAREAFENGQVNLPKVTRKSPKKSTLTEYLEDCKQASNDYDERDRIRQGLDNPQKIVSLIQTKGLKDTYVQCRQTGMFGKIKEDSENGQVPVHWDKFDQDTQVSVSNLSSAEIEDVMEGTPVRNNRNYEQILVGPNEEGNYHTRFPDEVNVHEHYASELRVDRGEETWADFPSIAAQLRDERNGYGYHRDLDW